MASPVSPRVFLVAKSCLKPKEGQEWLDYVGAPEVDVQQSDSNAVNIISAAAKRCYMSYKPGLNPNVSRVRSNYVEYLDNILASGHGSVFEHVTFTFAIENVSRVFTAEMNRHRAGWAISEGSLRYIRFGEDLKYVMPPSLAGAETPVADMASVNKTIEDLMQRKGGISFDMESGEEKLRLKKQLTRELMQTAFEAQERAYRVLEAIWEEELKPESPFKGKKELTSLFRRIVGMGCATGGVWTGNVRALRHVFALRTAPGAEEEIAFVFSHIAKRMIEEEPALFGDFTVTETGSVVPKYPKV